ncbi:hypothetical protein GALMADRAFT_229719 [Galerina marginata CBS 339.88]|uniref:F-box domain-containing protein n=1 Tax=Galerina marginata (strain CBS 339.88) TaxID=685588 RepID=A0A067SM14_GALM3|nr:hypothetical protein GALMADRAFT_229719 [Galerina marginata CBS 339.88]
MTTDQNTFSIQLQSLLVTNVDISDALKNQIIRKRDEAASKATFLQAELAQLFREINACNGLLAPIRRLPTDILLEVFNHHLGPELSSERMKNLLSLCQVTSRWRTLILRTPLMWNSLCISVECGHINSNPPKETPRNQVLRDMLATWLQRASRSGISLAIEIQHNFEGVNNGHNDSTNGLFLNTLILPHFHRIKCLHITACTIPTLFFGNLFPVPKELTTLVLRDSYYGTMMIDYEDLHRASPPLTILPSRLHCISLGGKIIHHPSIMTLLSWNQLTRLTLVEIPNALCLNIIRRCPNLVQGNFEFLEQGTTSSVELPGNTPTISLMFLENLSLYFSRGPLDLSVLNYLIVPKLHSLRLGSTSDDYDDTWDESEQFWEVIKNIESLALLGGIMGEELLDTFLEHTPGVLHLELDVAVNPGRVFDMLCPNSNASTLLPLLQHICIASRSRTAEGVYYLHPKDAPLPFRLSKLTSFLQERGFDEAAKGFHTVRHLVIGDKHVKSKDNWSNSQLAKGVRKLVSKGWPIAISMRPRISKREEADWKC